MKRGRAEVIVEEVRTAGQQDQFELSAGRDGDCRAERLRQVERLGRHPLGAGRAIRCPARQAKMADVIFNGTDGPPLGMAEVSLTIGGVDESI